MCFASPPAAAAAAAAALMLVLPAGPFQLSARALLLSPPLKLTAVLPQTAATTLKQLQVTPKSHMCLQHQA
jgi:hypothetical protein